MSVYGKRYTYNGKTQYLSEWAKETGISLWTLKKRIENYGWSLERAFTERIRPHNQVVFRGKKFSYRELGDAYGITAGTLRERTAVRGMPVAEALTLPVRSERHNAKGIKRMADGCIYPDCWHCPFEDCRTS